jgi:hypothetical protein
MVARVLASANAHGTRLTIGWDVANSSAVPVLVEVGRFAGFNYAEATWREIASEASRQV